MLVVAPSILTGCSEETVSAGGDVETYVNFRISIPDDAAATRAVTDDAYEDFKFGEVNENINNVHVLVVNSRNIVEVNADAIQLETQKYVYETGPVLVLGNDKKRIFVFANCDNLTLRQASGDSFTATTVSEILSYLPVGSYADDGYLNQYFSESVLFYSDYFSTTDGTLSGSSHSGVAPAPYEYLPFAEEATATVHQGAPEDNPEICDIYMHRAAAKYTYRIINETKRAHTLDVHVSINHVADRQYFMPHATYDTNQYGHQALKDYRVPATVADINVGTATQGIISRTFSSVTVPAREGNEASKTVLTPIYVMEGNHGYSASNPYMTRVVVEGYAYEPTLDSDWQPLYWHEPQDEETNGYNSPSGPEGSLMTDLPRNTHVVVNVIVREYDIKVETEIVPYNEVLLHPEFGLPASGYTPIYRTDGNIALWYSPKEKVYYAPNKRSVVANSNYELTYDRATNWCTIKSKNPAYRDYWYNVFTRNFYFSRDEQGNGMEEFDYFTEWSVERDSHGDVRYVTALANPAESLSITTQEYMYYQGHQLLLIRNTTPDAGGNYLPKYFYAVDNMTYYYPLQSDIDNSEIPDLKKVRYTANKLINK